jgi:hypothetical protein
VRFLNVQQEVLVEGRFDHHGSSWVLYRIVSLTPQAQEIELPEITENTVNDLIASYLRDNGLNITTQAGALVPRRRTPDFELRNGAILFGEGEWNSTYVKGYDQAIEFGDIPGAAGYFLIGYPDELRATNWDRFSICSTQRCDLSWNVQTKRRTNQPIPRKP